MCIFDKLILDWYTIEFRVISCSYYYKLTYLVIEATWYMYCVIYLTFRLAQQENT